MTAEFHLEVGNSVIEIWRADEKIGEIRITPTGLRLVLGEADERGRVTDPGGGATLLWGGDPFSMRFDLISHEE